MFELFTRCFRLDTERPTTTLYFTAALQQLIGPIGSKKHPVWLISPNVFLIPSQSSTIILVFREIDAQALPILKSIPSARYFYILDDDIWSGSVDPNLPASYRKKLRRLANGTARKMLYTAERIYVPSAKLISILAGKPAYLIHPCFFKNPPSLDHHDNPDFKIIFAGTRSHLHNLMSITSPLAHFLCDNPNSSLTTFLGKYAPSKLRLVNAIHHNPMNWQEYQKSLSSLQFHVGLAPTLPTAFNAARSSSKLLEFASYGAAPLLGTAHPFSHDVAEFGAAFTCNDRPDFFYNTLLFMAKNRTTTRKIAQNNCLLAHLRGSPQQLLEFWLSELNISL